MDEPRPGRLTIASGKTDLRPERVAVAFARRRAATGGRRPQYDAAAARRDQAAFAYRKAVLTAFSEVESALEGTGRLAEQEAAAVRQRAAAASALDHARKRYQAGYVAYLEELDAQRGLLATDLALSQVREARLQNAVALYQALGGGWTETSVSGR